MFSEKTLYPGSLQKKTLCLTFDDGPCEIAGDAAGPKTLRIATFLSEQGISATFFVVGKYINLYPDIVPKLIALGHTVGNHTYNHPDLPDYFLQNGSVTTEIRETDELLAPYTKNKNIFFRPPYGAWNKEIAIKLNSDMKDYKYSHTGPIGWDISVDDWQYWQQGKSERECADALLDKIVKEDRGIILMHDSTADDDQIKGNNLTYETLQILIPQLKKRGYTFVKLEEIRFSEIKREGAKSPRIVKLLKYGVSKYIWEHKVRKYFTGRQR